MTTTLDIIDTAVKIGLGATISGVTTYFITKRNQRHALKKEMLNDKKELLKECAFKLEKTGSILNHVTSSLYQLRKTTKDNKLLEWPKEQIIELQNAYNASKEARSIALLIGEPELAKSLKSYIDSLWAFCMTIEEDPFGYDINIINSEIKKLVQIKESALIKFGEIFESLYA